MDIVRFVVTVCGISSVGMAFATNGAWVYRADVGTSPMNAALWTDAANWKDGQIPSGDTAVMDLSTATNRYIRLDSSVTIYRFVGCSKGRPKIFGEGAMTIKGTGAGGDKSSQNVSFFVPLTVPDTRADTNERFGNCDIAADVNFPSGGMQSRDGGLAFRQDWYANDANPARGGIIFGQSSAWMRTHYYSYSFYAPPRLAEPSESTWKLTAGSAFATRVGTVSHALPVGTLVSSGSLLPSGTFLRRIFPDGTIELSRPAVGGDDAATIRFEAFEPKVVQSIPYVGRSVSDLVYYYANQQEAGDALRIEVNGFAQSGSSYPYGFGSESGSKPGTFVLKNTSAALYVTLSNGRVEFAGSDPQGTGAGLPNGYLKSAKGSVNYIVVTNGVTATIGTISDLQGTVYKLGAGTLVLPTSLANIKGKLVVAEGALSFPASDGEGVLSVDAGKIEIAAGGSLKIPSAGLRLSALPTFASGSSVVGPGLLVVPDATDVSSLPVDSNVQIVRESQYGLSADVYSFDDIQAATSPLDEGLPVPASWMDASDKDSLEVDGTDLHVWKDVRARTAAAGVTYPSASPQGSLYPQVVSDASGNTHHVYIEEMSGSATSAIAGTRALKYSASISGVKAVFKAFNGAGAMICDSNNHWFRTYPAYSRPLFNNTVPGTFYVNGEIRNPSKGCPYGAENATDKSKFDPEVAEFHFAYDKDWGYPSAVNIGFYSGATDGGRNGRDRICEMLVYTNELTFVQRQKICAYLMKKWMHGAEANVDYSGVTNRFVSAFAASEEVSVPVAEGQSVVFGKLDGSGRLVKKGEGSLYVQVLENAAAGIRVSGGTVKVRSTSLAQDSVPGVPYLHLDVSDDSTITEGPTDGTVARIRDVRKAVNLSAEVVNKVDGKYPTIVRNAQNSLPMIDYGTGVQVDALSDITGLRFPETDRLYAVFRVVGGQGGGVIAGYLGSSPVQWNANGEIHTVTRTEGGLDWGARTWVEGNRLANYAIGQSQGSVHSPGATSFRLDGVDCDPAASYRKKDGVELLAYNGYDHIITDALGCNYGSQQVAKYYSGNCRDGETILYTNTLSQASIRKVEAYLNKKWFGKDTTGIRPAFVGTLTVDENAAFEISGGAPVTVSEFSCAGTVKGAVALAADSKMTVCIDEDGNPKPVGVTGGVDFSNGGMIELSGNVRALAKGTYAVADVIPGTGFGVWTVTGKDLKANYRYKLGIAGGKAVLTVVPPGLVLVVR